jgi:hypothetical protein
MATDDGTHMVDAMSYVWQSSPQNMVYTNASTTAWLDEGAVHVHTPTKRRGLAGAVDDEVARIKALV